MNHEMIFLMYFFILLMLGIFFTWLYLLSSTTNSLKKSPKLTNSENIKYKSLWYPKVSIILPARNEAKYIKKCIDSLLKQTYSNFEIILVNDASSDNTLTIMKDYEKQYSKIIVLDLMTRPDGWIGKNWACYNGYLHSSGDLLLFTDADSHHYRTTLEITVSCMNTYKLQALTLIPKLLSNDIFTKLTLPIFITFLHTRYSALKVNNPKSKLGYFFGSYFIITKNIYEEIGSHKSVKNEIIEDGALGKKVKEGNYRMKMIRGENYVTAHWARNSRELVDAIDRLVIAFFKGNNIKTSMLAIALFFLILSPFVFFTFFLSNYLLSNDTLYLVISLISFLIIILIILTTMIHNNNTLNIHWLYSLGTPVGGTIIVLGFVKGIIKSINNGTINWRDRRYKIS